MRGMAGRRAGAEDLEVTRARAAYLRGYALGGEVRRRVRLIGAIWIWAALDVLAVVGEATVSTIGIVTARRRGA